MNKKRLILSILGNILAAFLLFYFILPPLNPTAPVFWVYLFVVAAIVVFTLVLPAAGGLKIKAPTGKNIRQMNWGLGKGLNKGMKIGTAVFGGIVAVILLINLFHTPLFRSNAYYERIQINRDGDFAGDVELVDFRALPLIDKVSSEKLGDRVMGQMPEWVSQFLVSDKYTQINYNNDIVRVTPLEYANFIKYFANCREGIKGYIIVNSVTGEASLVKLEQGMRYMPSAMFFENLERKLRFRYPTAIFGDASFEIDNEGKPYWIVPVMKYAAIGMRKDVQGVVLLDPVTGESVRYDVEDVPSWIDHVYPAELLIEQTNDWGKYENGFWNSLFSQKGVVTTTEGYNYTVMHDDVYLYTGITSVSNDESNLGFILSNMRTKETVFYVASGAEEYSAMASAEGQVQQMKYKASFPLLINLQGRPTYLMSLKDNSNLVKMYAFVDVVDYQKVSVSDSSKGIEYAAEQYLLLLGATPENPEDPPEPSYVTVKIASLADAVIEGTSYYYLTDTEGRRFRSSIQTAPLLLPFLAPGDWVTIGYQEQADVTEAVSLVSAVEPDASGD